MNAPHPLAAISVRAADLGDAAERARIDAYVAEHPDATLFHRPQWTWAIERGCGQRGHYLMAERGSVLVGCLPLSEIRSALFGNALVSTGFGTDGGLLADGETAIQALAAAAWRIVTDRGCASVELRGGPIPEQWQATSGTYAAFARDLPDDADTLMKSLPRRQRAEIRRAGRFELDISIGADARHRAAHYRVYAESVRNLGTPVFPRGLFDATLDSFGDEAEITLLSKDGQPISTILTFYFRGGSYPYWAGGTRAARTFSANDLAYFEVMRRAIERGCTLSDFGRSKIGTGPWQRKRIWGFDERPLVYGVRTADGSPPRSINPLSPKYRLQVAAWQRLPLWLANRLGPRIARGLG